MLPVPNVDLCSFGAWPSTAGLSCARCASVPSSGINLVWVEGGFGLEAARTPFKVVVSTRFFGVGAAGLAGVGRPGIIGPSTIISYLSVPAA